MAIKGGEGYTLSLYDPENTNGGGGCTEGGSKAGEPDGFGGTLDQDEVVVYGTDYSRPMWRQQTGSWVDQPCYACSDANSPRPVANRGLGTYLRDKYAHRTGCNGNGQVWQDFE